MEVIDGLLFICTYSLVFICTYWAGANGQAGQIIVLTMINYTLFFPSLVNPAPLKVFLRALSLYSVDIIATALPS